MINNTVITVIRITWSRLDAFDRARSSVVNMVLLMALRDETLNRQDALFDAGSLTINLGDSTRTADIRDLILGL